MREGTTWTDSNLAARPPVADYTARTHAMTTRTRLPALNLTAVLAVSAFAELIFDRVLNRAFLPSRDPTAVERWLSFFGVFVANFAGILALLIAIVAMLTALRSEQVFPRSMRITVSTIGLFFCVLAGMHVVWMLGASRYQVHLRISHGFLVLFLTIGIWHGARPLRHKLGLTLFGLPIVLEGVALFVHRMAWSSPDPARTVLLAHALTVAAMTAARVLLSPGPWKAGQTAVAFATGNTLAAGLGVVLVTRFDWVQAVAFYGLRIDLTGMTSAAEQAYAGALVVAFACLGAAIASCLVKPGGSRLAGWGLLLLLAAGMDITSAKPALFTLCGLLALAVSSAAEKQAQPALEAAAG